MPGGGRDSAYVLSLYLSLLVLLGNDTASSSRLLSIVMLMVGAALVAVIFGNMTVLLSNYDAQVRSGW